MNYEVISKKKLAKFMAGMLRAHLCLCVGVSVVGSLLNSSYSLGKAPGCTSIRKLIHSVIESGAVAWVAVSDNSACATGSGVEWPLSHLYPGSGTQDANCYNRESNPDTCGSRRLPDLTPFKIYYYY